MTDYAELCERLRAKARASFEANKSFGRKGKEWAIETEINWQAVAAIEHLSDSNEGLTEDLYQAVLVAYRLGAHEWARLNYPQWIDAIVAGQEVAPIASTTLKGADQ